MLPVADMMPELNTLPAMTLPVTLASRGTFKLPDKLILLANTSPAADTKPLVFMLRPVTFPPVLTAEVPMILPPVTLPAALIKPVISALPAERLPVNVVMLPAALMVLPAFTLPATILPVMLAVVDPDMAPVTSRPLLDTVTMFTLLTLLRMLPFMVGIFTAELLLNIVVVNCEIPVRK